MFVSDSSVPMAGEGLYAKTSLKVYTVTMAGVGLYTKTSLKAYMAPFLAGKDSTLRLASRYTWSPWRAAEGRTLRKD